MSEPLLSRGLDKYCENPNETLKEMLDESGIILYITEYTTPYYPPKIVLDTTKHDAKIRANVLDEIKEIIATKTNPIYWIEKMVKEQSND